MILPFSNFADAVAARDEFATFVADEFDVPCFLYGTGRTLPQLRKDAFTHLRPDVGPSAPHPTAGAICVGAREVLVAYNVILADSGITTAREIAGKLRSQHVRALGMEISAGAQVSMNLIAPTQVGPADVFDMISAMAQIDQCELVGLIPANVLQRIPKNRWGALDLTAEKTIEWQLAARNRRLTEN
jgi:glutamate formiminotransferase